MSISSGLIVCIALFIYVQFLITSLGKMWVFVSQATRMTAGEDNGTINVNLKFKPGKLTSSNVIRKTPSGSHVSQGAESAVGTNWNLREPERRHRHCLCTSTPQSGARLLASGEEQERGKRLTNTYQSKTLIKTFILCWKQAVDSFKCQSFH